MTSPTPQEIVERALAASTGHGCVAYLRTRSVANLRWARNTLTTNGETVSMTLTVVAFVDVPGGVAAGSVTVSAPTLDRVADVVRDAEAMAREDGAAEDAAPLAPAVASPDWADAPVYESGDVFSDLGPGLGELLARGRAADLEHFGYAEQAISTIYLGTTSGVRLRFVDSEGRLEDTAKSHGRTRSAWAGRAARSVRDLDVVSMDDELRRGLAWQERKVDVAPGRYDAVMTPSATADLMIDLFWHSVARDAFEGQSVWSSPGGSTKVGQTVADPRVTLLTDPSLAGLEAMPFVATAASSGDSSVFDNGLPVHPVRWIDRGVLSALITSRHTAALTGLPFNPATDNLRLEVEGGSGSVEDLVARTDDGLLVTCLWYNRVVDPQTLLLTGLTRDGVYVVKGGEVVGTAGNFRFNDSPVGVLSRVADAGAPVPTLAREMGDYFNRASMPPLRLSEFNFSTASQAY